MTEGTDEHIIRTQRGVVKSIHPRAEGSNWDCVFMSEPNPNKPGWKIRTSIADLDGEECPEEVEEPMCSKYKFEYEEEEEEIRKKVLREKTEREVVEIEWRVPRDMYVTSQDCHEYGFTKGCIGYRFLQGHVKTQVGHSHACRTRISEAMMADPKSTRDSCPSKIQQSPRGTLRPPQMDRRLRQSMKTRRHWAVKGG